MANRVKNLAAQGVPWRRGTHWTIILIEGIVAIALGIYILTVPGMAGLAISTLIGVFLTLSGLLRIYGSMFRTSTAPSEANACRGGIELLGGLLLIAFQFLTEPHGGSIQIVGGLAFALAGLFGIYVTLGDKGAGGIRWGELLESVLFIVVGGLFIYAVFTQNFLLDVIGGLLLLLGVILIGYGVYARLTARS